MKLLEDYKGVDPHELGLGKAFLHRTPKVKWQNIKQISWTSSE